MEFKTQTIRYVIQLILLICIIISFSFCNNTSKETTEEKVTEWIGDTLYLPETSEILYKDSVYQNGEPINNNAKLKIATLISGDCGSCVKDLKRWDKFFQFIGSKKEAEILFYLETSKLSYFKTRLYESTIHKYPLIIDKNFKFSDTNKLPPKDKRFQTFLLDSNNRVILVGNPVYNDKLMKLYKKEIKKRLN